MRNLLLTIQYDGTGFHGWQRQPGQRTVQGELEAVLSVLCRQPVTLAGASRTDAGVHALGQRAGFSGTFGIPTDRIAVAATRLLPGDVRIAAAEEVAPDFHPRFDAVGKTYAYRIRNHPDPSVLERDRHWHIERPLDADAMDEAAGRIVGEQDFRSFLAAGGNEPETTVRRMFRADCRREGDDIVFTVTGSGFLYNMVRILTGTLVEVGLGKRKPADLRAIIAGRDRALAGRTAPPQGLYLMEVYYDPAAIDRAAGTQRPPAADLNRGEAR